MWGSALPRLKLLEGQSDNVIAFDPFSGRTHFLSLPAFALLEVLAKSASDANQALRARMVQHLDVEPEDFSEIDLARVLHEMDELGLVFPV